MLLSALVFSLAIAAHAHVQPGLPRFSDEECRDGQPFLSYHIHTLFWQNNANSTNAALALQDEFAKHFGIYGNVSLISCLSLHSIEICQGTMPI